MSNNTDRSYFRRRTVWFVISTLAVGFLWLNRDRPPAVELSHPNRPVAVPNDGYVSSDSCRECHHEQHESWHSSFHRTMTQVASPESILAPIDGEQHSVRGFEFRFEQIGNDVFVEMPGGEDGIQVRNKLALVTGSHHMQVYWFETGHGRTLGQFPLMFLLDEQRWIPRQSGFLIPPDAPHADETGRWNVMCSRCHSTSPRLRPRFDDRSYDTLVSEFGIACEACHGPGEDHVAAARAGENNTQILDSIVLPTRLKQQEQSSVCGQCHSVFVSSASASASVVDQVNEKGALFRPGQRLSGFAVRTLVRCSGPILHPDVIRIIDSNPGYLSQSFWKDGMIRVSGREYNGLIESPCYQRGSLSCMSCHTMHRSSNDTREYDEWANDQLKPGMDGNAACIQCHEEYADDERLTSHTHHEVASSGSECMNCHMPHTTYGLIKASRSHEISSPSVGSVLNTGRPDACTLCHLDRPLSWTARQLHDWYGQNVPRLSEKLKSTSMAVELLLCGDAGQRALIAWAMGRREAQQASGTEWQAPFLLVTMDDPYDTVSQIAYRSLKAHPRYARYEFDFLVPLVKRRQQLSESIAEWNRTAPQILREELLFDTSGKLNEVRIGEFQQRRNNRIVILSE